MDNQELRPNDFAYVYLDVDNPDIAWLAYRGILNSPDIASTNPGNLSWFLMGVIKRGLVSTLRREGLLEGFRIKEFPESISRLRCVYAYPTLEMAARGDYGRGHFRKDNLVAIAPVSPEYKINSYDSNWITDFDSLPIDTARRYWQGEKAQKPHIELLLSGRFVIYGTSVRERAYETIKKAWPNSLTLLELSRLAAIFDSDLGTISPWLKKQGDKIVVSGLITYTEREGLEVFRRAIDQAKRDPTFKVNWKDLKPLCSSDPDPTLDALFCVPKMPEYNLRSEKLAELNEFILQVLDNQSS